jgi:hypothetical protein
MEHSAKAHQQSLEADKQSAHFATKHGEKKGQIYRAVSILN